VVSETEVAGEIEFTGTNNGPLASPAGEVPATGRSVTGYGAYFAEVRDGRIVSFTAYPEAMGMMAQLGLLPGSQPVPERVA
jgi:predicted ester cyclase